LVFLHSIDLRKLLEVQQSVGIYSEKSKMYRRNHNNLQIEKGLNQELGPRKPDDIRWGSHYGNVLNMIATFFCVIEDLKIVGI
jgi:hypothetical protein